MKKLIALSLAFCLITSGNLPHYTYAADDLKEFAASLGADTDYFNIPCSKKYTISPDGATEIIDESYSIAAVEVLVHNNVIKLSDIQDGAKHMNEIQNSAGLLDLLKEKSSGLVGHMMYKYLIKTGSPKEKIADLLKTAQEASEKNEYFLIIYGAMDEEYASKNNKSTRIFGHSAAGIGIKDGTWKFGDKTYDKCILTLDQTNLADNKPAFSDDTCIYINTETNDYLIPRYSDVVNSDINIIAIDGKTLVNGDISDIYRINVGNKNAISGTIYTITTEKDGQTTVRNSENDFLDYFHNSYNGDFYIKADKFQIERTGKSSARDYISITSEGSCVDIGLCAGKSIVETNGSSYTIKGSYSPKYISTDAEYNDHISFTDDLITNSGHWSIYGKIGESFFVEKRESSFVIDSEIPFISLRMSNDLDIAEYFCITQKTEVKYADGAVKFYIDSDNDEKFENEIKKGDVNCDGVIDAEDASLVLSDYANISSGKRIILNKTLADFNGDSAIDADDASLILKHYSAYQTGKN